MDEEETSSIFEETRLCLVVGFIDIDVTINLIRESPRNPCFL